MRNNPLFALLAIVLLLGTGCASLSNFNSPQTVEEDEVHMGIGVVGVTVAGQAVGPVPEIHGRVGLSERWDIGGKFIGPFGGISVDTKYQVVDAGLDVALDLGGSVYFTAPSAVHPGLFIGTEQFYAGGRMFLFNQRVQEDEFLDFLAFPRTLPGAVVGGSFGNDEFRVKPEIGVYLPGGGDDPILVPGLGLKFRIKE